jgi:putative flippase GtrA
MKKKIEEKKRPFIFLGVGIFNTVLDFSFYTFLTSTTFKNGHNIVIAGIISGTFALMIAFLTHGFITWRDTKVTHKTLFKFVIFTGFGLWVIRPLLLSLFIKLSGLFNWSQHIADNIGLHFSYNFVSNTGAFACALVIILSYNYFVYSRFVFTNKSETEKEDKTT